MVIVPFLAMTRAEIRANPGISSPIAWMACHFSPYGTGLSNLPDNLPPGSLLILNDRTPWWHHDPELILAQLEQRLEALSCRGLLLDLQRPEIPEVRELASLLSSRLGNRVAVSAAYARELSCPVFVPPVPLHQTLDDYLKPWKDRGIWLELGLESMEMKITVEGCIRTSLPCPGETDGFFREKTLHCHYRAVVEETMAKFTLTRTREDLNALLEEATQAGVTTAVGLWQELG